jgi:uncharacterized protein (DUF362 family)
MDRRTFIKALLAAGISPLVIDLNRWFPSAAAEERPVLGAASDRDPAGACAAAVGLIGGFGRFVPEGSRVVVKPNIGWDRTPEQAANTHPDIVLEVVRGCLGAGASEVLVFDRACNDPRLTYRTSGIQAAVEEIEDDRVKIFIPDRRKYVPVDIREGRAVKRWTFYEDALGADVFINLPILKHHSLCRLTMGLKNIMGVMGDNRGKIHNGFKEKIVDVNTVIPSNLTILDATRILTRHGPQGGNPKDVRRADTVVAGADIVAVDSYGARLFGTDPRRLDYLVHAHERGLGQVDLERVEIRKA